jgi:hypothetical protein
MLVCKNIKKKIQQTMKKKISTELSNVANIVVPEIDEILCWRHIGGSTNPTLGKRTWSECFGEEQNNSPCEYALTMRMGSLKHDEKEDVFHIVGLEVNDYYKFLQLFIWKNSGSNFAKCPDHMNVIHRKIVLKAADWTTPYCKGTKIVDFDHFKSKFFSMIVMTNALNDHFMTCVLNNTSFSMVFGITVNDKQEFQMNVKHVKVPNWF